MQGAPGGATPLVITGEFAVHVALVEGGQPTVGVVDFTVYGVTYRAAAGRAWRRTKASVPVAVSTQAAR